MIVKKMVDPTWTSPPKRTESSCIQSDMRREVEVGAVTESASVISATSSLNPYRENHKNYLNMTKWAGKNVGLNRASV